MTAPTLRDVAERAGVSIRTVSNVVNGYARVADSTRLRVQTALDELGYRPNLMARNLKQGRSRIIALVVPALDVPYFAELVRLIISEARTRGYAVLIDQTDGDVERERALVMQPSGAVSFDGLIVSPLALTAEDLLDSRRVSAPILLLGEKIFHSSADHVAIDNVAAAREATTHLIALGRRRIAAIGVHRDLTDGTAVLRTRGYREALAAAGLPTDESLMLPSCYERQCGAAAMAELLDRSDRPDAVFCFSDLLALGAMRAALSRGLRIPEDLAVVGFDNVEDGRYSTPTLTTIAPDKQHLAQAAVEHIVARIESDGCGAPIEITSPYRLVVRESTVGSAVLRTR